MNRTSWARFSWPVAVLLVGLGFVIVGVLIAATSGLDSADLGSHPSVVHPAFGGGITAEPLGIALLAAGCAVGAGLLGYLIGERRR